MRSTNRRIVSPRSAAAIPVYFLTAILKAALMRQAPTKRAQNRCPGIQWGTIPARIFVAVKCSVPNTAIGAARNNGPRATILSSPCLEANSFLAA